MANILRFPGSRADVYDKAGADDAQAWLVGDAVVYSFDPGFPVLKRTPSPLEGIDGDWSNQELADLYRVEAILSQAGAQLQTDRGLTDEGDPWFVFCNLDGEVYVHLARLNGQYLLDSPGLGKPIYGDDFAQLVDVFVRCQAERAPSGNVVRFRPGTGKDGVVQLHPAMMMAALIWALYLSSDHFAGTAEAAEIGDHGHTDVSPHLDDVPDKEDFVDAQKSAQQDAADVNELLPKSLGTEARSGPQTGGPLSNGVAASLSAIAASWGLFDAHLDPLPELLETAQGELLQLITSEEEGFSFETDWDLTFLATTGEHNALNESLAPEAYTSNEQGLQPSAFGSSARASVEANTQDILSNKIAVAFKHDPANALASPVAGPNSLVSEGILPLPSSHVEGDVATGQIQSLLNMTSSYTGGMKEYALGELTVAATFDISSIGKFAAKVILSHLPLLLQSEIDNDVGGDQFAMLPDSQQLSPDDTTFVIGNQRYDIPAYATAYSAYAKDFVHNFILSSPRVEVLRIDNAIIFVDPTAIDDPSDQTAVRSWSLDDTTTVSTIGHADYFARYLYFDHHLA